MENYYNIKKKGSKHTKPLFYSCWFGQITLTKEREKEEPKERYISLTYLAK